MKKNVLSTAVLVSLVVGVAQAQTKAVRGNSAPSKLSCLGRHNQLDLTVINSRGLLFNAKNQSNTPDAILKCSEAKVTKRPMPDQMLPVLICKNDQVVATILTGGFAGPGYISWNVINTADTNKNNPVLIDSGNCKVPMGR